MAARYRRPRDRRMLTLTVRGRERISPHFVSVTLGGDDFRYLEQSGYDQAGRLFFRGPGQGRVVFPTSEKWMRQYALLPAARRPRVRWYSIRRFRPERSEFDIEVAVHEETPAGPAGPGSGWALAAQPGDTVGFLDEGYAYVPTPDAAWQLLVGDESALPAVLAILERSTDTLRAEVFLEVPADDDIRDGITAPAATNIHWLPRNDPATKPGSLALRAVQDAQLPSGPCYAWTAGESSLATGIRRHLVNERKVPRSDVAFRGYWRHGRASLG
ncbi:siderophore-interacting protein [Streptomyces shenzhenensis]|uniref:NADPH-dependent ferric siderophore reductase n=1 Tax=Streptomyces shenzhenensis TaxID=943815 RepID=A0A3M0I9J6_9ACTN|nr:siderophore-interacting protein [Streptomyces shenzhenensis]RMB85022.1 NADPH-dependent ferric siderophore reductase [Streptomyces shenzhenensis]